MQQFHKRQKVPVLLVLDTFWQILCKFRRITVQPGTRPSSPPEDPGEEPRQESEDVMPSQPRGCIRKGVAGGGGGRGGLKGGGAWQGHLSSEGPPMVPLAPKVTKQNFGCQPQTLEGGGEGGVPPLLLRCTAVLIHPCTALTPTRTTMSLLFSPPVTCLRAWVRLERGGGVVLWVRVYCSPSRHHCPCGGLSPASAGRLHMQIRMCWGGRGGAQPGRHQRGMSRAGRKLLCGGGMAWKPICLTPPSPPSLVAVRGGGFGLGLPYLPCRGGGVSTPTSTAQNDPHVALIILTTHTWGKFFE